MRQAILASALVALFGCAQAPIYCDDSCAFAYDGECDDGRVGAATGYCTRGTDCTDCGYNEEAPAPEMSSRPDLTPPEGELMRIPHDFGTCCSEDFDQCSGTSTLMPCSGPYPSDTGLCSQPFYECGLRNMNFFGDEDHPWLPGRRESWSCMEGPFGFGCYNEAYVGDDRYTECGPPIECSGGRTLRHCIERSAWWNPIEPRTNYCNHYYESGSDFRFDCGCAPFENRRCTYVPYIEGRDMCDHLGVPLPGTDVEPPPPMLSPACRTYIGDALDNARDVYGMLGCSSCIDALERCLEGSNCTNVSLCQSNFVSCATRSCG